MNWKYNSKRKVYIPKLTKNKEIKQYIKNICTHLRNEETISSKIFNVFPVNSFHTISVTVYKMYDNAFIPQKKWKEFEISHFINMSYVDSIEIKLKSNGSIYFEYARPENTLLSSFPDVTDPFYLDSSKINWDKFASELKLWCIEIL